MQTVVSTVSGAVTTTPTDLFREWLARRIAERRLSQAQVALRSGVARSTVGRILSGDRHPTLDTAIGLVGALDDGVLPRFYARLGRTGDPFERVAHIVHADPHLSEADAAKLLRLYREMRGASNGPSDVSGGGAVV